MNHYDGLEDDYVNLIAVYTNNLNIQQDITNVVNGVNNSVDISININELLEQRVRDDVLGKGYTEQEILDILVEERKYLTEHAMGELEWAITLGHVRLGFKVAGVMGAVTWMYVGDKVTATVTGKLGMPSTLDIVMAY